MDERKVELEILAAIAVLIWTIHDIKTGRTSDRYRYSKKDYPANYWTSVTFRLLLSIGCLFLSCRESLSRSRKHETIVFKSEQPIQDQLDIGNSESSSLGSVSRALGIFQTKSDNEVNTAAEKNATANELFSLPELPEGVVSDLARMFRSPGEDEVWRDYCLQFLGSALEREDGVTDADRALARETLVEALSSTNATFAGTALRALHRGAPADPLVASNALRIARDPTYSPSSRTAALLILEDCVRATPPTSSTTPTTSTASILAETASAGSADPAASSLLRRTAEAVLERNAD